MAKKLDKIHIDLSKIFGYNLPLMCVISPREGGKSTKAWLHVWSLFKKGHPTIALRRRVIDINEPYINDTFKILIKFADDFDINKCKFNKGGFKDGVVDVFYDGQLFIRFIGLSKDLYALKGLIVENIGLILFDEFICNTRLGEKYLKDEAFKFKELYNTFQRECNGTLRCLFLGNPYSLYNPYFDWWGVDTTKLKAGSIVTGINYVIWCYELSEELKAHILAKNPLYQFDDAYTKYGFNGTAINDSNIRINKIMPVNYNLIYGFRIGGNFIGIFSNTNYLDFDTQFYIKEIENISSKKNIYCFDFNDLLDRTALVSFEDKTKFARLKRAFRERRILFNNLKCYYLMEEVYTTL